MRLFLAFLVGLLVFIIAALLIGFGRTSALATERAVLQWNTAADAAADALRGFPADTTSPEVLEGYLLSIRVRYDIGAAVIERGGTTITSGLTTDLTGVQRAIPGGKLTCYFDASALRDARRTFVLMATICAIATLAGIILLTLYLPKITRPIELMLDQAGQLSTREAGQEDTHYLVETFSKSVAVLKAQEEELRHLHALQKSRADELERVSSALTRSILSGFLAIDRDGRIHDVNHAAREVMPLPPIVNGLCLTEALGSNQFSQMLVGAFEERRALTRAEAEIVVDESRRLIGLTTVPLMNEADEFLGMLALFTDLTPFRELETRVREMKNFADLGEISAGIAHEFRNSLATILGYLRLSKRAAASPDAMTAIEKAEREAAGLSAAVDSLLSFARPMELNSRPVDLLELSESVTERVRVNTAVEIRCAGESAVIQGDGALLERAVENVVRNAAESVARKTTAGSVEVRVATAPTPRIVVTDDGVGVNPAEVATLFLPFRSANPNGHGLGLPLAKKIVLLHGGNIWLTGEPGQGATATIEFGGSPIPRAQRQRADRYNS